MPSITDVASKLISLADTVNDYLPGAPATQAAIDLAKGVGDLIDGFSDEIPLDKQAEAQAARKLIAERVTAKARQLSQDLRG